MRLAQPLEKSGFFWLPEEPDNRLPGTLRISESGAPTLEVIGLFEDPFAAWQRDAGTNGIRQPDFDRILGRVEEYGLVALDQCLYTATKFVPGGVSKSTLLAHFAFLGVNYEKRKEVTFSEFRFSVEGLDKWLSIYGIDFKSDLKEKGATIVFSPPEKISLSLHDGIDMEFNFDWTLPPPINLGVTEARVTQKAFISLRSSDARPLEYLSSLALKICNFLCFAIDQTVSMDSITGYSRELTGENGQTEQRKFPIKIYYESAPYSDLRPQIDRQRMLFRYHNVGHRLEVILNKWLDSYETFEPAFNLYFASTYDHRQYIDVRFLRLAQGLETLHRRSSQETEMSKDDFKNLLNSIIHSCPDDKRELVRDKLSYANALPLRRRVERMIEPFQEFFGNEEESKSLVKRIVDNRNYLTHYSGKLESKAASNEDLLMLCDKLEALFQLHILRLIGFDAAPINIIVENNGSLYRKLRT